MTNFRKITLLAAAAAAIATVPASAAIVITTSSANNGSIAIDPGFAGQTLIYDFDSVSPLAGNLTGNFEIAAAPGTSGLTAAPSGTVNGTRYLSVPANGTSGTATLQLGGAYSAASFYWGSIDSYNTLEVLSGNTVLRSVTGAQLPMPTAANGNQTLENTNRRLTFTATAGEQITGFRFTSDDRAFETDSFAGVAVPEPASWAMMIAGFGLVGGAMRSRRSTLAFA